MIVPFTFLLRALRDAKVRRWLIGGHARELIVGRDLRPHDDLDLFVAHADAGAATAVLEGLGFRQVHGSLKDGDVFYRRNGLVIDLVPVLR
ncbi:MAG: nucleotidyltransferase domain-containing protein [Deinococcus sp.]